MAEYENIYILTCKCFTKWLHAFGIQKTNSIELPIKTCLDCKTKYKIDGVIKQRSSTNNFKTFTEVDK